MLLHHEPLTAPGAAPRSAVLFLHGILGRGANLRTLAKRVVDELPDRVGVLVDLRAHGESMGTEGKDSLDQAAADVVETAASLPWPVTAAVGHSFGGKVALGTVGRLPSLEDVVLLDCMPGARRDRRGSEAIEAVLRALDSLPPRHASRTDFMQRLEQAGQPRALAQWLAMNLVGDGGELRFGLALPRIRRLLDTYFEQDLWPTLEGLGTGRPRVHLIIAARSRVYEEADRQRARQLAGASLGAVTVDEVDADHWLHVEAPDAVHALIVGALHR